MRGSTSAAAAGARWRTAGGRSAETEDALTYPQHPGPPQGPCPGQPYPGQRPYPAPYPQTPYGTPPAKPSGATAIIAGVLAVPGGILLFARKPIGRLLTIIGSGLAVLVTLVSVVLGVVGLWQFGAGIGGAYLGGAIAGLPLVLLPAAATLILAIVRPTALWCGRATPGAVGYPPGRG